MKTLIIEQKMSGTGSIYDIASNQADREIRFRKNSKYAVVLADYYGGKGYTTHKTEQAAINASRRESCFNRIIDIDGNVYDLDGYGDLVVVYNLTDD